MMTIMKKRLVESIRNHASFTQCHHYGNFVILMESGATKVFLKSRCPIPDLGWPAKRHCFLLPIQQLEVNLVLVVSFLNCDHHIDCTHYHGPTMDMSLLHSKKSTTVLLLLLLLLVVVLVVVVVVVKLQPSNILQKDGDPVVHLDLSLLKDILCVLCVKTEASTHRISSRRDRPRCIIQKQIEESLWQIHQPAEKGTVGHGTDETCQVSACPSDKSTGSGPPGGEIPTI